MLEPRRVACDRLHVTGLTVGSEFEGYRLQAELGEGGFARVYRAVDRGGREVALKVLSHTEPDGYDSTTVARFDREVAILSRLRNPHTVRLLAHGRSGSGMLYLVFELLGGRDLVDMLEERGRLAGHEVEAILRQVLGALEEAHRAGLLHRDIKPHNIRVVSEAPLDVRLLDFGIARSTDDGHPSVTKTGELIGTPRYMSPEQLMGQPLGPASDVYSLGVVAFELLMGRDALAENNVWSQVGRLRSGHAFSVSEVEQTSVALVTVIERMTAREVDMRLASARAVLAALAPRAQAPRTESVPTEAPVESDNLRSAAVIAVVLVVLTATVVAVMLSGSDDAAAPHVPSAVLTVRDDPTPPKPISQDIVPDVDASPALEPDLPTPPLPEHGSVGCGKQPGHEGRGRVAGEEVYIPTDYEPFHAHPLLILGHHKWDDPGEFMMDSGFAALADARRFIIAAPDNGNRAWEDRDRFLPQVRAIADELKRTTCIDERRVYFVGHSRGGRGALAAGCEPWIAAIAVNSFLPKAHEYRERWWCERPVPTLWLSPTNSHMVRLDGARGCVSPRIKLPDFEAAWRERNACKPTTSETKMTGGTCRSWACDAALKSCELDGGHYWPGVTPHTIDVMNCQRLELDEPDAPRFATAEQIWLFFESL